MILGSNNTLSRGMSFNRSGKGRDWSSGGLTNRICRFNDINVIFVDFNNRWYFRCRFRCNFEDVLAGAEKFNFDIYYYSTFFCMLQNYVSSKSSKFDME